MENGQRSVAMVKGTLRVQSEGDSLVAIVRLVPDPGEAPRPETRMTARRVDGPVTFQRKAIATTLVNGEERKVEILTNWTLTARGDALEGRFLVANPEVLPAGAGGGEPHAVKGMRVRP